MIDPDRVLQPLRAEEGAIGRLETYSSSSELADAVVAVRDAVDRVLRLLLRNDPGAPDDLRLSALSPSDVPHDRLIPALRRRELISLSLAGSIHELERVAARAETGDIHATDADLARRVVVELAGEVRGSSAPLPVVVEDPGARTDTVEDVVHPAGLSEGDSPRGRFGLLAAVALTLAALIFMVVWLGSRSSTVEEAIAAFGADDFAGAEALFEEAVRADSGAVTALLYLGRIYRRDGRFSDAASVLSAAEDHAPDDPDVRRELGYLFMDLNRPAAAAQQFDRARELDPGNDRNWIGLIQALRAAGDPDAEVWLDRAPPAVKAVLTPAPPRGNADSMG